MGFDGAYTVFGVACLGLLMGHGKMNAIKVMVVCVGGVYCAFCLSVMWVYHACVILHNFY